MPVVRRETETDEDGFVFYKEIYDDGSVSYSVAEEDSHKVPFIENYNWDNPPPPRRMTHDEELAWFFSRAITGTFIGFIFGGMAMGGTGLVLVLILPKQLALAGALLVGGATALYCIVNVFGAPSSNLPEEVTNSGQPRSC